MREYLLTLCVAAAVTYLLTGPVRKFAIAAGAVPPIRARDVHREPTPRLGGIAMFGGLCAGLLVASQLSNIGEVFRLSDEPRALLAGAGLIWLLGVLDDKWGVDALVKLGCQMIAAGVMVFQGLTILWLPVPGVGVVALTPLQGTLLTVTLVVVTINAVNFVDGLDGLAAGMVCIAAAAFFLYAYRLWYGHGIEAAAPATLFAAVLMGMCLGFLPHNMHPARIFMGDSGSMLLGLVLAAGAVSITGQVDPDRMQLFTGSVRATVIEMVPVYIPVLLPLTIIAVPVADLLLAIVRRTWRGHSPFAADRGHLHHRLLEIGHSHSRAVLIMYFWAALIAFGAIWWSVQQDTVLVVPTIVVLSALGLLVLLLPRFSPRVPEWAERLVPPRYRRVPAGDPAGGDTGDDTSASGADTVSAPGAGTAPNAASARAGEGPGDGTGAVEGDGTREAGAGPARPGEGTGDAAGETAPAGGTGTDRPASAAGETTGGTGGDTGPEGGRAAEDPGTEGAPERPVRSANGATALGGRQGSAPSRRRSGSHR